VDHPATFEEYVHNVRSTSVWGGQLELRALSEGLKRPIVVFSAESPPLIMGAEYLAPTRIQDSGVSSSGNSDDDDWDVNSALLLSFHRQYYALGEHYNSVIPQLMK
jgi:OTU domain-containing protein 6